MKGVKFLMKILDTTQCVYTFEKLIISNDFPSSSNRT